MTAVATGGGHGAGRRSRPRHGAGGASPSRDPTATDRAATVAAIIATTPATTYTDAVQVIARPNPNRSPARPMATGARLPPVQPTVFIRPAAVPRTSGRTTS